MRFVYFSVLFLILNIKAEAQKDLFESTKLPARKGWLIGVNANYDMAQADMAKSFGNSFRIGPSVHYKFKNNWIFGAKLDFISGGKIKAAGDSFMRDISDADNNIYNVDGQKIKINKYERGYVVGLEGGYIFNTSKRVTDNGIMLLTGVGFMQHKILIQDKSESIRSLMKAQRKGYDRLSNGMYIEQYVGYFHVANDALVNFHVGFSVLVGFNQGRRDFLYDVMRPGTDKRTDVLIGVRAGWYLPIFKRKSEEFFFE